MLDLISLNISITSLHAVESLSRITVPRRAYIYIYHSVKGLKSEYGRNFVLYDATLQVTASKFISCFTLPDVDRQNV